MPIPIWKGRPKVGKLATWNLMQSVVVHLFGQHLVMHITLTRTWHRDATDFTLDSL